MNRYYVDRYHKVKPLLPGLLAVARVEDHTIGSNGCARLAIQRDWPVWVRRTLRQTEPRLAVGAVETLDVRIVRSIRIEQLLGWLTMAFGGAALTLACLGLFRDHLKRSQARTAELVIGVALGDRRVVQWLIVREALLLVLLGGAIGLPLAFLAARALRVLFYGIAPSHSVSCATAAGVLIVVCACAAYMLAWRASRLDPIVALRGE